MLDISSSSWSGSDISLNNGRDICRSLKRSFSQNVYNAMNQDILLKCTLADIQDKRDVLGALYY